MPSLGLSTGFRDLNLNQVTDLLSKNILELISAYLKVQERNDQLGLSCSKPQLELETNVQTHWPTAT